MNQGVLVAAGGASLFGLLLFQFLVGKRIIKFKGKLHQQVHRGAAWALLLLAPAHGIFATHTFLGWPF